MIPALILLLISGLSTLFSTLLTHLAEVLEPERQL